MTHFFKRFFSRRSRPVSWPEYGYPDRGASALDVALSDAFAARRPDRDTTAARIAAAIVIGGCLHGLEQMDDEEIARQSYSLADALAREADQCK